jgi:hypothetical protein
MPDSLINSHICLEHLQYPSQGQNVRLVDLKVLPTPVLEYVGQRLSYSSFKTQTDGSGHRKVLDLLGMGNIHFCEFPGR